MTRLETYMNDPEIMNEPLPLREVHAVRLMIYDETKNMSPDERKAYQAKNIEEAMKRYNIKFVTNVR